ncbi:MAG: hypothetical protein PVI40_06885 [Chlamydiota bacterium]|jgi:hypothetical protein
MTSISNITDIPRDIIALIGEFSENFAFLPVVSEKFKEKGFIEESQKTARLAAERIRGCLSNINEIPNDAIALIGEFSGNIDFLPAVADKFFFQMEGFCEKGAEVGNLAKAKTPTIAMDSLLAEESEINEITDLQKRSEALKNLVEKYATLVTSRRLLRSTPHVKKVSKICGEIYRIVKTIPDENLQRHAECITDSKGLFWFHV